MTAIEPTPDMMTYQTMMAEIKSRLAIAREDIADTSTDKGYMRMIVRVESCVLQARLICELIALACLAIHERHDRYSEGLKLYHAGDILKKLSTINEEFFPRAIRISDEGGRKAIDFDETTEFTRDKLIEFYGKLGGMLHRGQLKKLTGDIPREYDVARLSRWFITVTLFLENHCIKVEGDSDAVIVQMHGGAKRGVMVRRGALSHN
ncbi:hypothetical protein [uncultured Sphingomonas sp.]|uniref:hypothetical protein n=1 Tax=uncultured Sphingomonas sp. TaxID=158754 RepID=UPI0025D093E8|nr:hypothetical protein [uncultured Sphingomonas sp.]